MGLNNYACYDKKKVDDYTTLINGQRATAAEKQLVEATQALPATMTPMPGAEHQGIGRMQVELAEAHLLTMLTRDLSRQLNRPMKALDIGTFTGHSAGALARGMEAGGRVITCDITDSYQDIAEQYWNAEGVRPMIEHRIDPLDANNYGGAHKVMDALVKNDDEVGTFDIVFVDAEKTGYDDYYEKALKLLRPGGKIILDNVLWSGRVADTSLTAEKCASAKDNDTPAFRVLNDKIAKDARVDCVLLNADDGIMVVEKRGYRRG